MNAFIHQVQDILFFGHKYSDILKCPVQEAAVALRRWNLTLSTKLLCIITYFLSLHTDLHLHLQPSSGMFEYVLVC